MMQFVRAERGNRHPTDDINVLEKTKYVLMYNVFKDFSSED